MVFVAVFFAGQWSVSQFGQSYFTSAAVEIDAFHTAGSDWVRFYNTTGEEVDLSQYFLTDGDNKYEFPAQKLAPNGYWTVGDFLEKDKYKGTAPDDYWGKPTDNDQDWGLSKDGEAILLVNKADSSVADFVYSPAMTKNQTAHRDRDGSGEWMLTENGLTTSMRVASGKSPRQSGIYTAFQIQGLLETFEQLNGLWDALLFLATWLGAQFTHKKWQQGSAPPPGATDQDADADAVAV